MSVFFIVLFFVIFIFISAFLLIEWSVHISMTKEDSKKYGWGNYKKFIREFNKYNWDDKGWNIGKPHNPSFWDRENKCKLHADIIKFNDIGMVINNPIDLQRVKKHMKQYYIEKYNPIHKW